MTRITESTESIASINVDQSVGTSVIIGPPNSNESLNALMTDLQVFFAKLYANPQIPRNTIQDFSVEFRQFFDNYNDMFSQLVETKNVTFHETLKNFSSKLSDFSSDYKRLEHFESVGSLVLPAEVVIGSRLEYTHNKGLVHVNCTMQVIPLKFVLTKFFSIPNVLEDCVEYLSHLYCTGDYKENIVQGLVWRKMQNNFDKRDDVLNFPLILYFDDFETNNPLGSHNSIQKLGAVYVSVPILPRKYFSQLTNIFLLGLFHSADRTNFGNSVTFGKIIDELNGLSHSGIPAFLDGKSMTLKFHVAAVSGDNLGLNGILGFVESFVAQHCCRICRVNKAQMQSMCQENAIYLRNNDNYTDDLSLSDPSQTGIKEKCAFLALRGFDMFENVTVDVLHDFLEGTCRYVMDFLVNYLVLDQRILMFSVLVARITNFNYGPDKSSKPVNAIVCIGSKLRVKTSASE
ncbi:uncharacterized protein LOC103521131, partial [Diaphorina citri]|uniref:Uncharacterized protein LOC103521131 n=1 Tax=Diaphorina citri TaxID=121845 RepID=A0A1S3DLT0_DIACI